MKQHPPFSVQERDIDLLILEQLHVSAPFVTWLAERSGLSGARFEAAHHSVFRRNGETDVLLFVSSPAGRVAIMIEDKIGAPMQPRQCERYHERGRALCDEGEAARYTTVLCAPAAYLNGVPADEDWHARIALEEIANWFSRDSSPAAAWRSAILTAAGSKMTPCPARG